MDSAGLGLPPHTLREWVSLVACTHLADPAGSPEQREGALGTPEAESRSSSPQQPSKQGDSPSNPIGATQHPGCLSRRGSGNLLDAALVSKTQSAGWGAGPGSSSSALELHHGGMASTGETLGRFLTRWKTGGSQRQREESRTKFSRARLKAKRALPSTKAGETRLRKKKKKSGLV